MTENLRNDLVLSEALTNLVDEGSLSEGSREYQVAQKVVRDGRAALDPDEAGLFRDKVVPLLGKGFEA